MAGRLGAIFGAPRFTPGFPADGFGGTSVAVLTTGFGVGFGAGFAGVDAVKRRERMPFFSATGGHEFHEIRNAATVTPLVVIPGHNLDEVVAEQHGAGRVNDCGAGVATEVRGDEWFI